MEKLSSDYLFYKGLVGLIAGPIAIILFVKFIMINNVPDLFKDFIYFLVLVLLITQGRLAYKTRQVFYTNKEMVFKNYFTRQSEEVQFTDIVSLKKAFSLQKENNRNLFKLTYLKQDKKNIIYFFRTLDLSAVDDLDVFIGLDKINKKSN